MKAYQLYQHQWYQSLNKPNFTPPDWFFNFVWITLYILMACSFILLFRDGTAKGKAMPITLFIVQLALNFSWAPVFFGLHDISLAFMICCLLWVFLLFTIISFYHFSKISAYLLIPYMIWVTCAVYLNYKILILN